MKKKHYFLLIVLLVFASFGIVQQDIYADTVEYDLWVGGNRVTGTNTSGSGWTYDALSNTLTLNNYTYQGQGFKSNVQSQYMNAAIVYLGGDDLIIHLEGTNRLTMTVGDKPVNNTGIFSLAGTTRFTGSGSLYIKACEGPTFSGGIYVENKYITVTGGPYIEAVGEKVNTSPCRSFGIECEGLTLDGGTIIAKSGNSPQGSAAIYGNLIIYDGTVRADGGNGSLWCYGIGGELTIYGGNVSASSWDNGIRSVPVREPIIGPGVSLKETSSGSYAVSYVSHSHELTYLADGATITAICSSKETNPACGWTDKKATLTMTAPEHTVYGDGKDAQVTVSDPYGIGRKSEVIYYKAGQDGEKEGNPLAALPLDPGNYYAEITIGGATAHLSYKIDKRTPSITGMPAPAPITYGQSLAESGLTGGQAKDGDTEVAGTFAWKDPSAKPACSDSDSTQYDVLFTPAEPDYYYAVAAKVKLKVNKAEMQVNPPLPRTGLVCTGEPQDLITAGSTEDGTISYAVNTTNTLPDKGDFKESIPSASIADTYYIWYKGEGDKNHDDQTAVGPMIVTIEAAKMELTVQGTVAVYDGQSYGIDIYVSKPAKGAEISYSTRVNGPWSKEPVTFTDAGNHTVWYRVQADNYITETGSADVKISKAANHVTVAIANWTVGKKASIPSTGADFAADDEPSITYKKTAEPDGTPVADEKWTDQVPSEPGHYLIKATVKDTSNYAGSQATAEFRILTFAQDLGEIIRQAAESASEEEQAALYEEYMVLDDDQKKVVEETAGPDAMKAVLDAYDMKVAEAVEDLLKALDENSTAEDIRIAREAYHALNEEQKALIDKDVHDKHLENEKKILDAETAILALTKESSEQDVAAARALFDALSHVYQEIIYEEAVKNLKEAEQAVADRKAAMKKMVTDTRKAVDTARTNPVNENVTAAEKALALLDQQANIQSLHDLYDQTYGQGALDMDKTAIAAARKALNDKASKDAADAGQTKPAAEKAKASISISKKTYNIKRGKTAKIKIKKTTDGKITFKKVKGNKYIKVTKAGKIKVKKGAKKGKTYKIKVKVTAAESSSFRKVSLTRQLKVKVKR